MKLDQLTTIDEMALFLDGSQPIAFAVAANKDELYRFVEKILERFAYASLGRHEKGIMRRFLRHSRL